MEAHAASSQHELPNLVSLLREHFVGTPFGHFLLVWENIIFSSLIVIFLLVLCFLAGKRTGLVPTGLQNVLEGFVEAIDSFICGILGPQGRRFTPFIGTIFVYILLMNLMGIVPFFKSATASWSTTLALALCVCVYVQYVAIRELGFFGYLDHMAGKPRGFMAATVLIPLFMFLMHVMGEFIKPLSLSLRLRSNMWGDEMLLGVLASFGLTGIPLMVFNMVMMLVAATVQAVVFSLLATIYFAVVLEDHEQEHIKKEGGSI